jgi:hypothetical protein
MALPTGQLLAEVAASRTRRSPPAVVEWRREDADSGRQTEGSAWRPIDLYPFRVWS